MWAQSGTQEESPWCRSLQFSSQFSKNSVGHIETLWLFHCLTSYFYLCGISNLPWPRVPSTGLLAPSPQSSLLLPSLLPTWWPAYSQKVEFVWWEFWNSKAIVTYFHRCGNALSLPHWLPIAQHLEIVFPTNEYISFFHREPQSWCVYTSVSLSSLWWWSLWPCPGYRVLMALWNVLVLLDAA